MFGIKFKILIISGLMRCFSTKLPYIVVDKIVEYKIKNGKEATYNLNCNLKARKNENDFCYKGRYNWDQEDDIDVSVSGDGEFNYACSEELKWSNVDIIPVDRIVHSNENVNVKLCLSNLYISKLSKHSYLSCKMTEKVKHLVLSAVVDSNLKPSEKAVFIVQNPLGEEVSRETVKYDERTNSYKKNISYPRRGRKYIIKWDYKNNQSI